MKKFFILLSFISLCNSVHSQSKDIFKQQLAGYFKTDPFGKTTDSLLKELSNDSDLLIDTLILPSPTTGLYIRGFYKTFNPFSQKMSKVILIVHEAAPIKNSKKVPKQKNKGLTFQIIGLTDSSENGKSIAIIAEDSIHYTLKQYYPRNIRKESPPESGYNGYSRAYYRAVYPQIMTGVGKCMPDSKSYSVLIRIDLGFIVN